MCGKRHRAGLWKYTQPWRLLFLQSLILENSSFLTNRGLMSIVATNVTETLTFPPRSVATKIKENGKKDTLIKVSLPIVSHVNRLGLYTNEYKTSKNNYYVFWSVVWEYKEGEESVRGPQWVPMHFARGAIPRRPETLNTSFFRSFRIYAPPRIIFRN